MVDYYFFFLIIASLTSFALGMGVIIIIIITYIISAKEVMFTDVTSLLENGEKCFTLLVTQVPRRRYALFECF